MMPIAILHCSDLHFGSALVNRPPRWLVQTMQGYAAHDIRLCLAMKPALEDVGDLAGLPEEEEPKVVVSGDLTAAGADKEFAVAHTFLRSLWRLWRAPPLGAGFDLRRPDAVDLPLATVPGNHDQWGGSRVWMWGYDPELAPTHFRPTPWRRVWNSGNLEVEFFGLDTNAGLDHRRPNPLAGGSLDQRPGGEVDRLRALLEQSDKEGSEKSATVRIRALVLHHPLSGKGLPYPLDANSVDVLLRLAEAYNLTAFLTGHTHEFFFQALETRPNRRRKVWELRCASTLQGPTRRRPRPGFLAHKIWLDEGNRPRWVTWRYPWSKANRFAPRNRLTPCQVVL
ncbi:MAG: metallophosphoesterase [Planctomycetes bacterium]|nr:metallophosphoesterase [Planctomycetota bacterium]